MLPHSSQGESHPGLFQRSIRASEGERYSDETGSLGFTGIYERLLAAQAGFADDAEGYRAAIGSRARLIREASALEE